MNSYGVCYKDLSREHHVYKSDTEIIKYVPSTGLVIWSSLKHSLELNIVLKLGTTNSEKGKRNLYFLDAWKNLKMKCILFYVADTLNILNSFRYPLSVS